MSESKSILRAYQLAITEIGVVPKDAGIFQIKNLEIVRFEFCLYIYKL